MPAGRVHLRLMVRAMTACGIKPKAERGDSFDPAKVTCRICREIQRGLSARGPILLPPKN
jgi:hypothetical protein